jgi:hypothetical protein
MHGRNILEFGKQIGKDNIAGNGFDLTGVDLGIPSCGFSSPRGLDIRIGGQTGGEAIQQISAFTGA